MNHLVINATDGGMAGIKTDKMLSCLACKDCKHAKKYWLADGLISCVHPDKISPEGYMPIHSEQWTCECATPSP